MKVTEQTTQQIERFIKKIAQKFPKSDDTSVLTDIHIRVSPDIIGGDLMKNLDADLDSFLDNLLKE